jgi:hypothetical protein
MDHEELKVIRDLFAKAEQRLKVIEARPGAGLEIPSVNQLRYAGYHLLAYVVDGSTPDLEKAKGHCQRAIYDAYELELGFYIDTFGTFCEEFLELPISETIPEFLNWVEAYQSAQTVVASRRQADGREKYYAQLEPHIETLGAIEKRLPAARDQLARKRRMLHREERHARLAIWIAGAAALLAVAGCAFWLFPEEGRDLGRVLKHYVSSDSRASSAPSSPSR